MKTLLTVLFMIATQLTAQQAQARFKEIGDFPSDRTFMWSEETQGVAHDEYHWYFAQADALWKIPTTTDLNKNFDDSNKDFGVIKATIPTYLRNKGYYHMGDIDHDRGFIYVPLEGQKPFKLLIYRAKDLAFVGEADFPIWQDHAPWLAVHPTSGEIYISEFNPDKNVGVYRYKLLRENGKFQLKLSGTLQLRTYTGDKTLRVRRIQGGSFDKMNNLLILASDASDGGLYAFDANSGNLKMHDYVNFSPGFPNYEEIEGIDIWHNPPGGQVHGSVHLLLLDNDLGPDDIYFKHFRYQ